MPFKVLAKPMARSLASKFSTHPLRVTTPSVVMTSILCEATARSNRGFPPVSQVILLMAGFWAHPVGEIRKRGVGGLTGTSQLSTTGVR
jgi:hypothetical protein